MIIWQEKDWPNFKWSLNSLLSQLTKNYHAQGVLLGSMLQVEAATQKEAHHKTLMLEAKQSKAIAGTNIDPNIIQTTLLQDVTQHFNAPLTQERLWGWHQALMAESNEPNAGCWRTCDQTEGFHTTNHFEPLPHARIASEMTDFLNWFNQSEMDPMIKAGLVHIWLAAIQPFDSENELIVNAITILLLARTQQSSQLFYSFSAQIMVERNTYDYLIAGALKGGVDAKAWLDWFLSCLGRAIEGANVLLSGIKGKAQFWEQLSATPLNARQRIMLNQILSGLQGNLTTTKWADLTACSQDTAYRDILDLIDKGVLRKAKPSGRSSHYKLVIKEKG